jgi:hypothetical protein
MGVQHGYEERKAKSLELARLKFPDCLAKLARAKDHDRAEALLIVEWHRKSTCLFAMP